MKFQSASLSSDHSAGLEYVDKFLVLAKKVPEGVRKRIIRWPNVFRKLTGLDDEALDKLLENLDDETS